MFVLSFVYLYLYDETKLHTYTHHSNIQVNERLNLNSISRATRLL